jgi:hypothetical protein
MRLVVIALLAFLGVLRADAEPAQIILLRHAEKPADGSDVHLSAEGQERARALIGFLTTTPALTNHGPPAVLFACQTTARGHGRRCLETLQPLAIHLRLAIDTTWPAREYMALAQHVRSDERYAGKAVVICWVHDYLPELAKALGLRPKPRPWNKDVYDQVWLIAYRDHDASLTRLPQRLLPGDAGRQPDGAETDLHPGASGEITTQPQKSVRLR